MTTNITFNQNDVQFFCFREDGHIEYSKEIINQFEIGTVYDNAIIGENGIVSHKKNSIHLSDKPNKLIFLCDVPLDLASYSLALTKHTIAYIRDCFNLFAIRIKLGLPINDFVLNLWKQYAKEYLGHKFLPNTVWHKANITDNWKELSNNEDYLALFDREMIELSNQIFGEIAPIDAAKLNAKILIDKTLRTVKLLCDRKEHMTAQKIVEQALKIEPNNPFLTQELAMVKSEHYPQEAVEILLEEEKKYTNAELLNNLSSAYKATGDMTKAVEYAEKAVEANPNSPELHNNLGHQYLTVFEFDKAIKSFKKAIELNGEPYVWTNLGNAYVNSRKFDLAFECYHKALEYDSEDPGTHVNLGFLNYMIGNHKEGWKECEYRLKTELKSYMDSFGSERKWDGKENIKGKRLAVFAEQGLGDGINFVRYLSVLKQKYECHVILVCYESTMDLFEFCNGIDEMVDKRGFDLNCFDLHIPLMSLPYILDCDPPSCPYINYEKKIDLGNQFNVGICWKGNPKHPHDHFRSCSLDLFERFQLPGVKLWCMQQQSCPRWAVSPRHRDLIDAATMLNSLDLLITVDTSLLHLAGALGRPVWGLFSYVNDWRWGVNTTTSEWYPSLKLFRQSTPGDWESVFNQVLEELRITSTTAHGIARG